MDRESERISVAAAAAAAAITVKKDNVDGDGEKVKECVFGVTFSLDRESCIKESKQSFIHR